MKISLRWLCDHIAGLSWTDINVDELIKKFNAKVAEIEHVQHRIVSLDHFVAARVALEGTQFRATLSTGKTFLLPVRSDLHFPLHPEAACLITLDSSPARWVTLEDMGLEKEGLVPVLHIPDSALAGSWASSWESEDIILDVDNKSLTHRPDMWGHRGFAREVAALFGKRLNNCAELTFPLAVTRSPESDLQSSDGSLRVTNDAPTACSGFSGVRVSTISSVGCDVRATSRLIAIEYRPRSAAVDVTNYAMADWGQPLHAYDAERIQGKQLRVRWAHSGEALVLLDGSSLKLDPADIVVADGSDTVVSLAGIMGGKHDSVSSSTTGIILEAGTFHASTVRRSGARHKVRTESSQRFEKTLDVQRILLALERCAALGIQWGLWKQADIHEAVCSLPAYEKRTLFVAHSYLTDRIGVDLDASLITSLLESISFVVSPAEQNGIAGYDIEIPSYRATKDVAGPHDIVEEVARLYGYENIEPVLPAVMQRSSDIEPVLRERKIKQHCASSGLQEQRNYAFYNEPALSDLGWREEEGISLQNPVSQEARRLVTSLVPHLLANVADNVAGEDRCAFFEWGTVWPHGVESERKELAAVWYDKRGSLSFYRLKQVVLELFRMTAFSVSWELPAEGTAPQWAAPSPIACLKHEGESIGYFGLLHPVMLQKMGGLPESNAYVFVCNASLLQNNRLPRYTVGNMSKYQHSTVDVSVMVPKSSFVAPLQSLIMKASPLVESVSLIDFFEKKEWTDVRSIAFRITLSSPERTLTKDEVETVRVHIIQLLGNTGAQLRE